MRKHPGEGHGGRQAAPGAFRRAFSVLRDGLVIHVWRASERWSSTMLHIATVAKSWGEQGLFSRWTCTVEAEQEYRWMGIELFCVITDDDGGIFNNAA